MTTEELVEEFRTTVSASRFQCGACAEAFFTGGAWHEHTCDESKDSPGVVISYAEST